MDGALAAVEFEEKGGAELPVSRRDLLAFLYDTERQLQAVLNLSTSRVLLLQRGGACFLATAAFGEDAPELVAFRALRDEVLLQSRVGRLTVRGYYKVGPWAAKAVSHSPRLRRAVRRALLPVHGWLVRRGLT